MPAGETQCVIRNTRGWIPLGQSMSSRTMGTTLAATAECRRFVMPIPLRIGDQKEDSACI